MTVRLQRAEQGMSTAVGHLTMCAVCSYYAEQKWIDGMSTAVERCSLRANAIAARQQHLEQEAEQAQQLVRLRRPSLWLQDGK